MGMYTGIRFKGTIYERFRKGFGVIAMDGKWENFDDEYFEEFSKLGRSGFIPCGSLAYMPDEWEEDYINANGEREIDFGSYYKQVATDGFERSYNEETGYWTFQCSLKNYESEIEQFFDLIPYFVESIEHIEYFYEEFEYSRKYELIDRKVVLANNKFIAYNEY